jgi:hypothetical protein
MLARERNVMSRSDEAWTEVGDQFKKLGSTFKRLYETGDVDQQAEPPSDDEVKDALRTLGESVSHAFATVGGAFNDPEVKEESRQAAGLFFDALGATFSGLGDDISSRSETEQRPSPPAASSQPEESHEQDQS